MKFESDLVTGIQTFGLDLLVGVTDLDHTETKTRAGSPAQSLVVDTGPTAQSQLRHEPDFSPDMRTSVSVRLPAGSVGSGIAPRKYRS